MASFRVSPGVDVKEFDLTLGIRNISTSVGGLAGDFAWGPVHEATTISTEIELVQKFGKPNTSNAGYWFTAETFLGYSDNLKVIRTNQTGATNAVAGGTDSPNVLSIHNPTHYDELTFDESAGYFAAKYPGERGNSLKIAYCPADAFTYDHWMSDDGEVDYRLYVPGPPGTSAYCNARGIANDEIHVLVIDENGKFSEEPGTILERFPYLSLASDAVSEGGQSNYFANVLQRESRYVYWINNDTYLSNANAGRTTDWIKANTSQVTIPDIGDRYVYFDSVNSGSPVASVEYSFIDGADGTASSAAQLLSAYSYFTNTTEIDVNIILGGLTPSNQLDAVTHCTNLIEIAENRHDCIVCLSPPTFGNIGSYAYQDESKPVAFTDLLPSSSFGVIDSCALKKYDRYNGVYRWIPANGSVGGLMARTDDNQFPWYSPAGFDRGQIRDVAKLSFNPTETQRDELYKARVNPIVQFAGEGTILYGDKTLLSRPSAFDRINVRRLFNVLEKAISTSAKYMLFEFNDAFTRARFVNMVEPYLRTVQANRGITDFLVVCDESNNTPDIIDSNNFVADIYIKPNRVINFITLNFIATPTGVEFSEVVGGY